MAKIRCVGPGIDPRAEITDQQGRPFLASTGTVLQALL